MVDREYIALIEGKMEKEEGTIVSWLRESDTNLMYSASKKGDGQKAVTKYKVIQKNEKYSLVDVHIETGRKNQIRVHFSAIGHPLIGDFLYGSKSDFINRQALHSYHISFIHPISNKIINIYCELPDDMKKIG